VHIERVQGGGEQYLQCMVRFPGVASLDPWWTSYRRRMAAAPGLRDITSAYRMCVRQDGGIDRLFSAVVDPGKEQPARRFFGAFSFLEGLAEESVALPVDAAEFASWATDFPELRCRIIAPALQTEEKAWLACDFRVAPHLEMLEGEAQTLGFVFGYQVHFRPYAPDAERLRRIGRNLIALQGLNGAPRALVADQERQVRSFAGASLLIEEIVAVDRPKAAEWLADALTRAFKADQSRSRMETPTFDFVGGDCGADPTMMMHSTLLYGDWTGDDIYCSQAVADQFRASVLSHRPPADPTVAYRPGGSDESPRTPEPPPTPFPNDIDLPIPFEGKDHIFVSYRRSDLRRIAPTLQRLANEGRPIWYDRGISGGDEWDIVLERKIEDAALVLAFVSEAAVESKYCRREIKFADAIDKPLLVVMLEAATLQYGLKFLLLQLQQISAADHQFDTRLDQAITNLLGRGKSDVER
jgi:TIR domain